MPYLKFRVSCSPVDTSNNSPVYDGARTRPRLHGLCCYLKKKIISEDPEAMITAGFETFNNYGEPCAHHFHLHAFFDIDKLSNPLRTFKDSLRKEAKKFGIHLAGNKVWACTLIEEPSDVDRFLRYPLKETPVKVLCANAWGHNERDIDPCGEVTSLFKQNTLLAREEQKRSIELNILKRAKTIEKQSFRDKLFEHLDKLNFGAIKDEQQASENPTSKTIWIQILDYYQTVKKGSICFQTIDGYVIGYQLHIKTLSYEECYEMRLKSKK